MDIWLISKYASLPWYGPGARLFYLAREFHLRGHRVLLVTSDANHFCSFPASESRYNFESSDGVEICWIQTKKYTKTASAGRVLSWFDFERGVFGMPRDGLPAPNAVIVSSLSLLSVLNGYRLKRAYGAQLVFEVRDIWPLTMVEEGGFRPWHPLVVLLGMVEKFGYRVADLVVGTMPRLDVHVRQIIGEDRPFHCSPLGFAPESLAEETPLSDNVLQRYFPKGKAVVGYAGSMGITNALDPLMGCIEQLSERKDIHFVLVGSGALKETYLERMSGRENVTFMPRIHKNEVPSFLRACDVLYLSAHDSSLWRFGQSLNKMVDYMLAGRPVVASYSGYQSMLNEASAGVFIPAGDVPALVNAVLKMVDMPRAERAEMGGRGRAWLLANRSYETLGREYLRALGQVGFPQ